MTNPNPIDAVRESFRELQALERTRRQTQAVMIRACIKQLRKPQASEREKALVALAQLAEMLEKD